MACGRRGALLLLLAACNHQPLPSGGTDLAQASSDLSQPDLAGQDLALGCIATPVAITGSLSGAPLNVSYGWAWYTAGDCSETPNLLFRGDDMPTRDPLSINIGFQPHATTGDQMVMVVVWTDSMTQPIEATGSANLTVAEPLDSLSLPTLVGTLSVNDKGVVLSGSFSVRHCPMLDQYCI